MGEGGGGGGWGGGGVRGGGGGARGRGGGGGATGSPLPAWQKGGNPSRSYLAVGCSLARHQSRTWPGEQDHSSINHNIHQ